MPGPDDAAARLGRRRRARTAAPTTVPRARRRGPSRADPRGGDGRAGRLTRRDWRKTAPLKASQCTREEEGEREPRQTQNPRTPRVVLRTGLSGAVGFEPTKAEPSDLQSDPFVHFGTRPASEPNDPPLRIGRWSIGRRGAFSRKPRANTEAAAAVRQGRPRPGRPARRPRHRRRVLRRRHGGGHEACGGGKPAGGHEEGASQVHGADDRTQAARPRVGRSCVAGNNPWVASAAQGFFVAAQD